LGEFTVPILLILVGFVVLIAGGEVLVRGASGMARAMHISPLVIGLTVVAFCTSAPELAVSLMAAFQDKTDLAVGNIVGSCTANILFVLGLSALVGALVVNARLVRREVPLMILAAVAVLALGYDGSIGRLDGAILVAALAVYMTWTVLASRKESREIKEQLARRASTVPADGALVALRQFALVLVGVAMLLVASKLLVDGAVRIAQVFGVSQLMIGLTILALGTSLPEAATCTVASFRGQRDIAVGNAVGSNILNILAVLGFTALVAPSGVRVSSVALHFDIPVMIVVSMACLPIFFTGHRINRWDGGLLLAYYFGYITYLVLDAIHSPVAHGFAMGVVLVVLPLTAVTLLLGVVRQFRADDA